MELEVIRFSSGADSTNGILLDKTNNKFLAYTLEDEYREEKKYGETRIPNGTYKLQLRKEGGYHQKYSKRFSDIHVGMLHVIDVPGFIGKSTQAYKRIYPTIAEAINCGEEVTITYKTV